uniref:DUF1015 family protein n=1 Tax=uncultured Alcanivorax sp. TaxID=191215 RepID=UPI00262984DE
QPLDLLAFAQRIGGGQGMLGLELTDGLRVLEPLGEGTVFPHEETHAAAKLDRLKLYTACRAQLSPIFGIYPDPDKGWPSAEEMMQQVSQLLDRLEHDPVEKMPGDFIMLARVFGTLGGFFLHYQPKVDIAALVLGYLTRPLDNQLAA